MCKKLIYVENCRIENDKDVFIKNLSWTMNEGEVWLIIGPNGGGKADFVKALSNAEKVRFVPSLQSESFYSNYFGDSVETVSLERAARLIQEERENDESEYIEGGVDIGRTGRVFIAEGVLGCVKKNTPLPEEFLHLEENEAVKICGIERILDRGIKYMSTGEIRRTLLARALISGKKLLVLSDPFAGLDVQSRTILLNFFNSIAQKMSETHTIEEPCSNEQFPHIILAMERWHEIPPAVTNVIEFSQKQVTFCGKKADYEKILEQRRLDEKKSEEKEKAAFSGALNQTLQETKVLQQDNQLNDEILVQMNNVNVGWGDNCVLKNLSWELKKGEHWLVRGPNGSGKTTFLELITGDNKQVFCNDVRLFGKKRGTGESIWDIKKQLGIVSYRLHVEYRMVGDTTLENVIISGFRDSIGLYEAATDVERAAAKKWLELGGFQGRENNTFGSLSYGEQRAILILRSAVKCPKILILDEPCHGLDEQYRKKILQLMEEIAQGGTTTLLHVTHDASEVLSCEKHILELIPNHNPMYSIIERNV